jgi:hypothetical protein
MDPSTLHLIHHQLRCLALVSACSPAAVLHAMQQQDRNTAQLVRNICSLPLQLPCTEAAQEENKRRALLTKACQCSALEVLLHLVVTADLHEGIALADRDKLKQHCLARGLPAVLTGMAGADDLAWPCMRTGSCGGCG